MTQYSKDEVTRYSGGIGHDFVIRRYREDGRLALERSYPSIIVVRALDAILQSGIQKIYLCKHPPYNSAFTNKAYSYEEFTGILLKAIDDNIPEYYLSEKRKINAPGYLPCLLGDLAAIGEQKDPAGILAKYFEIS